MDYTEVSDLPHVISYAGSGCNLVTSYMELLLDRPGAFFPNDGGEQDQYKRVTLLDPEREDFLWVHVPYMSCASVFMGRGPRLYIYRDPVATLFAWFEWMQFAWGDPASILSPARMLHRHLQMHLVGDHKCEEVLRIEDWVADPQPHVERIAKFLKPDYVFDPNKLPTIQPGALAERAKMYNAKCHDYMGYYGPPITSNTGKRFEALHEKRIRDIVITPELKPFFG